MNRRIILTGFMGTGKTTVGKIVAERLGVPFVDLDEEISRRAQRSIAEIFDREGEAAFRALESRILREILEVKHENVVLATGGGTLLSPSNRLLCEQAGLVICLTCTPEVLKERLQAEEIAQRPLLNAEDPKQALQILWEERQKAYAEIFWQLDTSRKSPDQIANSVIRLAEIVSIEVNYPGGCYKILIGERLSETVGTVLQSYQVPPGTQVAIITNETIAALHALSLTTYLQAEGYPTTLIVIPDGEVYKTPETALYLYEQLLEARIDRGNLIIALGGGVIGDIAGFVASTYMRGLPILHIPTSLLAMVDASIGGKTGLDLPQGKNLIGTFKQPLAILVDPSYLSTLPPDELRSGMAEVIKHGIVGDPNLFALLEMEPRDTAPRKEVLAQAIAVKARVVQADPYEQDLRAILNLGHTIGHALETLSNYMLRHGEAVSIGMAVEAMLAEQLGVTSRKTVERIHNILQKWDLPLFHPLLENEALLEIIHHDKKHKRGKLRWALPSQIGKVILVSDVEEKCVKQAIRSLREVVHE
ncbi:3-dehydroquinate synthase [uncultured Thermanaerothrix sp.]|uniref:3-dehydroquinate synthase n=1 Tax=uncultured Thermanaerothrix sp. TaxID=1195149 RepID=UPI00261D4074|nr:3-dehydroquinate synthase [uncultured Thermanaerothrix sp.]